MERQKRVINVVVGNGFFGRHRIGPLFNYDGLSAKYFSVSADIPQGLMNLDIHSGNFWLVMEEQIRELGDRIRVPTIQEALWCAGFLSTQLSAVVCERPVRFPHKPFRSVTDKRNDPEGLRHIIVRRSPTGYSTETVPANAPLSGEYLAYVINIKTR